jgi:hypothetical protein
LEALLIPACRAIQKIAAETAYQDGEKTKYLGFCKMIVYKNTYFL